MSEKSSRYEEGADIARLLIEFWKSLPDDTKKEMKKKIDVHHGEVGAPVTAIGHLLLMSDNRDLKDVGEFLRGLGETLIIDDIRDIFKWFRPRCR